MIINGQGLLARRPIKDMNPKKTRLHGVSHGLSEAGYDIRLKQTIEFHPPIIDNTGLIKRSAYVIVYDDDGPCVQRWGHFTRASAIEEFEMPTNMVGEVKDKSTWARHGLSVFNTVIEPGWKGFLTLELKHFGPDILVLPAGAGIAQVLFTPTREHASYTGKYQDQANMPVAGIKDQDYCLHPARNGAHEIYGRPDGTSYCRACGEEFGIGS